MNGNPQTIFTWQAPLRPFIKRSSTVIRFYIALTVLVSVILIFFGDRIILIPVWSLLFIFYVFTVTPPQEVTNKITRFGVITSGNTIRWEDLSYFFFTKRFGYDVLVLVTHAPYLHHFYLVVPDEKVRMSIAESLSSHILFQEHPQKTLTDRLVEWFSHLIPTEEVVMQSVSEQKYPTSSPSHQVVDPNASPLHQSLQYTQLPPSLAQSGQDRQGYQESPLESPDGSDRVVL